MTCRMDDAVDVCSAGAGEAELRLLDLPDDVLILILSHLRPRQLICEHKFRVTRCELCDWINDCAMALTCRKLQRLVQSEELWRRLVARTFVTDVALFAPDSTVRHEDGKCAEQLLVNVPPQEGEQLVSWMEVYRRLAVTTFPTSLEVVPDPFDSSWYLDRETGIVRWRSNQMLGGNRSIRSLMPFNLREMEAPKGPMGSYHSLPGGALAFRPQLDRNGDVNYRVVKTNVYYFEITVLGPADALDSEADVAPCICIGLTTDHLKRLSEQPGWSSSSYGIHSDDGSVFNGNIFVKYTSNQFGVGDTIGCGIRFQPDDGDKTRFQIFFTKNGRFLCMAFPREADDKIAVVSSNHFYFPVVGVDAYDICFQSNFGQMPFLYDLDTLDGNLLPEYSAVRQSWHAARQSAVGRTL